MKLHQFILDIARAPRLLDATGNLSALLVDMPVRVGKPDTVQKDEAVILEFSVDGEQADSTAQLLRTIPEGSLVIALIKAPPDKLPVGTLIDILVDGGLQATYALPIIDGEFRTAVAAWRSSGKMASVAPHLDVQRHVPLTEGGAMLRVLAEHVLEGAVWRVTEVAAHDDMTRLKHERDEARLFADITQKTADAAREQMAILRETHRQQQADSEARVAAVQQRLAQILESKSYRAARALSAPARVFRSRSSRR